MKHAVPFLILFSISSAYAQNELKPVEGYTPQIGFMVHMLEEIKDRITEDTKDLNLAETDFLFDDKANSIGAIIMHLVATEAYYQVETLEGRTWTKEESDLWMTSAGLGEKARNKLEGEEITHYLDLWDQVRAKSLEGLKTKDDDWFAANIEEGINNHWVWFHVLEHQANHMGQIELIKARLPE